LQYFSFDHAIVKQVMNDCGMYEPIDD